MKPLGRTGNYMTEYPIKYEWVECAECGGKGEIWKIIGKEEYETEDRVTCPVCLGDKGYEVER